MSTPDPVAPPGCIRDRVFVSYSHLDAQWLDKLREFLHPDIRNGRIDYRDDHNLAPGEKWYEELAGYIAHARVAVLLVSPNFLASDFIREKELPLILGGRGAGADQSSGSR
jgi:internalin A